MAIPSSKATLKTYCLRALGFGVIDINVSDDQVDDRLDEALQYFAQYHYDGVERMYLKHQITDDELTRALQNTTTTATDKLDGTITANWLEGKGFIPVPDTVVSVVQVFSFDDQATNNMFDLRYQLRLNDLYDFSSTSIIHYEMTQRHLDFLSHLLVGEKPIRFNQHQNRLYIDMDWTNDLDVDEYLIIDCYRKLDPATYTDVFNDIWVKRYVTQKFKLQWGQNLSKFAGVTMIGGVSLNGMEIMQQAESEILKLEQEVRSNYEEPPHLILG